MCSIEKFNWNKFSFQNMKTFIPVQYMTFQEFNNLLTWP